MHKHNHNLFEILFSDIDIPSGDDESLDDCELSGFSVKPTDALFFDAVRGDEGPEAEAELEVWSDDLYAVWDREDLESLEADNADVYATMVADDALSTERDAQWTRATDGFDRAWMTTDQALRFEVGDRDADGGES